MCGIEQIFRFVCAKKRGTFTELTLEKRMGKVGQAVRPKEGSHMKRVLQFVAIALLVVVGSSTLQAQSNPLVGTWKLNVTKTKYDPGPAPKSLTRTVVAKGDGV